MRPSTCGSSAASRSTSSRRSSATARSRSRPGAAASRRSRPAAAGRWRATRAVGPRSTASGSTSAPICALRGSATSGRTAIAAGGRSVSTKLTLPDPPADAVRSPWALRSTDLDTHGHVNNAVYWQAVEHRLAREGVSLAEPHRARLDYRDPIDLGRRRRRRWLRRRGRPALSRVRGGRSRPRRGLGRAARRRLTLRQSRASPRSSCACPDASGAAPGAARRAERGDAAPPGCGKVGAGREAVVELEHDHPVGERECGAGGVRIAAGRRDERRGSAILETGLPGARAVAAGPSSAGTDADGRAPRHGRPRPARPEGRRCPRPRARTRRRSRRAPPR